MKRRILSILLIIGITLATITTASPIESVYTIDTIDSLIEIIKSSYYKEIDDDTLLKGAIDGIFKSLDPHSNYMDEEEFKELLEFTDGNFGGIGVSIERKDDRITVVSPIEGTPAHEANLNTGDIIISVDDVDIKDYTLDKAVNLIRGEVNTKVKLSVIKADTQETIEIEITRAIIKIESIKTETPYGKKSTEEIKDQNIGYIRITEFSDNTYKDFKELIDKYKKENKKGLIIDLRSNPGGLLNSVVQICKEIIPEGPIVHIEGKNKENSNTYYSNLKTPPFKIAVITNGGSASASEILAGAVKDSKAGIIVGTKTYGKGTVQNIMYLTNGGGVKLTIAEYMTRNKIHIDGKGVEPDVEVEPFTIREIPIEIKAERDIRHGDVGIDVYAIQQRLINLGYNIKADGIMGKATLGAVNKLLKANNYQEVRYLEKETQKKIYNLYESTLVNQIK
ncbi:MAG: PDZ domain-containing protein, partial [Clostridium sp.]|nr:PDZ domain-containing protein [Clostridium sp.]